MSKREDSEVTAKSAPPPPAEAEAAELQLDPMVENVRAVADLHARFDKEAGHHQRRIESLTQIIGRPATLYILVLLSFAWIGFNSLAPLLKLPRIDPSPFYWLQGFVGLAALVMATMVLITQNRQGKLAARRALLDLHVNLLAEQKIAKLIALLEELRRDLPSVHNREDPQVEAMSRPVDLPAVVSKLEERIEQALTGQLSDPIARASGQPMTAAEDIEEMAEVVREMNESANSGPSRG